MSVNFINDAEIQRSNKTLRKSKVKLKRTVIIEFDSIKITSDRHFGEILWCESCRNQTKFLSSAEILEIAEMIGINRTFEKGIFHFFHKSETVRLICLKSILNCLKPD